MGGEPFLIDVGFLVEDILKRVGVKPGGSDDICAALLFQKECQPKWDLGAVRWA